MLQTGLLNQIRQHVNMNVQSNPCVLLIHIMLWIVVMEIGQVTVLGGEFCSVHKSLLIKHSNYRTDAVDVRIPEALQKSGFRKDCTGGYYMYVASSPTTFGEKAELWSPPIHTDETGDGAVRSTLALI